MVSPVQRLARKLTDNAMYDALPRPWLDRITNQIPPRRSRGQKEHKTEWNIPSENAIITRLDELYEALDRFPDSPMAPAWQHEIERLKEQLAYAG